MIKHLKILENSELSWYMKNDKFYFMIASNKKKYTFACCFKETVEKWSTAFQKCLENIKRYHDSISSFDKNDSVIFDRIEERCEKKQISPKKFNQ